MDPHAAFELLAPAGAPAPVVVHVPHSGTRIPEELRGTFHLSDDELVEELRRMTDHRTDLLAADVGAFGATRFVNRLSRLVVDPERFTDPDREEMETVGMGAVYTRTSGGRALRTVSDEVRAGLLARYFDPYHAAFTALVDEQVARHGGCTIVDLHSYPSQPLPYELHAEGPRPQLCIGTDVRHTPGRIVDVVVEVARGHGVEVAVDTPFSGSFVPSRFLDDQRVRSVMLEVRRDVYLDEARTEPHAGEDRIRRLCTDVVHALAGEFTFGATGR